MHRIDITSGQQRPSHDPARDGEFLEYSDLLGTTLTELNGMEPDTTFEKRVNIRICARAALWLTGNILSSPQLLRDLSFTCQAYGILKDQKHPIASEILRDLLKASPQLPKAGLFETYQRALRDPNARDRGVIPIIEEILDSDIEAADRDITQPINNNSLAEQVKEANEKLPSYEERSKSVATTK